MPNEIIRFRTLECFSYNVQLTAAFGTRNEKKCVRAWLLVWCNNLTLSGTFSFINRNDYHQRFFFLSKVKRHRLFFSPIWILCVTSLRLEPTKLRELIHFGACAHRKSEKKIHMNTLNV